MSLLAKAQQFAALHKQGDPLVLYNIWDAGSAKAIADGGAAAVATGSWSVAGAQGYSDGEAIPLDMVLSIASRIAASVDVPVSIDFEGGYSAAPEELTENVSRLLDTGVIGINFEDQVIGGSGLYTVEEQTDRIKALRSARKKSDLPFFLNARTDLFLKEQDQSQHEGLMSEAKARAAAYEAAGADGFFVPGLVIPDLISQICKSTSLPVNIMKNASAPTIEELSSLGVSRISHGPGPYREAMQALGERFQSITG